MEKEDNKLFLFLLLLLLLFFLLALPPSSSSSLFSSSLFPPPLSRIFDPCPLTLFSCPPPAFFSHERFKRQKRCWTHSRMGRWSLVSPHPNCGMPASCATRRCTQTRASLFSRSSASPHLLPPTFPLRQCSCTRQAARSLSSPPSLSTRLTTCASTTQTATPPAKCPPEPC